MRALPTEQRNQDTVNIDEVSTLEMLKMINNEDKKVAYCIEAHLDQIAAAVDAMAEVFAQGGRIVYCGAGTSGRMGFMDAAECIPTFGIPKGRVVSLIAGGLTAMSEAVEDAEDHKDMGVADLKSIHFSSADVLVGIAASGRTPYVIGAVEYAKELGAVTVCVICNENPEIELAQIVDYPIAVYAGPEAITGSTRMKAGTVQKMVLNMLSTGVMVKTGKVYSNLMVNVQPINEKLIVRANSIVQQITDKDAETVRKTLEETGYDVAVSIFMLLTGTDQEQARTLLAQSNGHIKKALASYE